jgi:hypothetical protein
MLVLFSIIVVAFAVLIAWAASRPNQFRVERGTVIQASPEQVFEHLDSFARWSAWSPWEKLDPAMKRHYSGPERGVGAAYHWIGNKQVGEGKMEIIEVKSFRKLKVKLDFIKPFTAHNTAEFILRPLPSDPPTQNPACHISWAMYGPSPFISKLMGLFFNMDKLIGKDFESGLASLKSLAESPRLSR